MTFEQLHKQLQTRVPEPMDITARYAVLVPLVETGHGLHLLYEVRSARLRRQPGEICFPGGRMEPGESAVRCALRETREELSIPSDSIQVLGPLDFICHRSGFVMYPILARVDAQAVKDLVPNPAEVEETFLIPLSALRSMGDEQYRMSWSPPPERISPTSASASPETIPGSRGWNPAPSIPGRARPSGA